MAFETYLIAIRQVQGRFDIASDTVAHIDLGRCERKAELRTFPIKLPTSTVLPSSLLESFRNIFLPESNPWSKSAREWYAGLPNNFPFIVVNESEWESGLNDNER